MLELLMAARGTFVPFELAPHIDIYWTNDYVQRLFHVRDWTWSDTMGNTYHFTNRNRGQETGTRVWRSSVYFDQTSLPAEPHLVLPPGATSFSDPDAPRGSHYWYLLEVFKGVGNSEFTGPFEASALGINVGPGPQELIAGNPGAGFYGEVPVSGLITGDQLAAQIGLTQGTSQHSNEPWLKFALDGKTLYVAKRPYRHSVSWDQIHARGAVFGGRIIELNGESFKVRLLKGANTDPTTTPTGTYDPEGTWGSEWNRLMYPLIPNIANANQIPTYPVSGEGIRFGSFASYTETDLVISSGNGRASWTQETNAVSAGQRVYRGSLGVSRFYFYTSSYVNTSGGWRPALELLS